MSPASNSPAVEALRILERARTLAPDRPDVTERLARAHELVGRADTAIQYRLLSARQWEEHGYAEAAERIYRGVLDKDPGHAAAGQCLIDLLLDAERQDEAGSLLLGCAERLLDRGDAARAVDVLKRGRERVSEPALERKLAELLERTGASADAAQSLLNLARQAGQEGRRGEAITFYRRALALAPGDAASAAELAGLLASEGQIEEARRLYLALADAQEQALAWQNALEWLTRAEALGEPSAPLLSRLAETARKAERLPEARGALLRLVDAYEALENTRQTAETLRRFLELFPDELAQRVRLAEACHAMGQPGEAARQLWDVAKRQAAAGQSDAALESYLRAWPWAPDEPGLVEAVVAALEEAGRRPEAAEVCLERAAALRLPRQAVQVERLCRKALACAPGHVAARERLVDALSALGNRAEAAEVALEVAQHRAEEGVLASAESWVQRARQLAPGHPGARDMLLSLVEKSGDRQRLERAYLEEAGELWASNCKDEALGMIESALAFLPDSEALLRRRLEFAREGTDAADRHAALLPLARLYDARPASPEALAVYVQWAAEEPAARAPAEKWLALAEALAAPAAVEEARRHLVELLRAEGDRPALLTHVSKLLASHPDDLALAEERLSLAGKETPAETRRAWRIALAEAAFRAGLFGKAMEIYGRLADGEPEHVPWHEQRALCALKLGGQADAVAAYRLAAARLAEAGKPSEAYSLLRRAVELAPAQSALRAEEAALLLALNQPFRAAAVERELAAIHVREGSFEKAVDALKAAVRLLPEDAGLRLELLDVYRQAGMIRAALEEAHGFAEACHAAGRPAEALDVLERALALDPRNRPLLLLRLRWLAEAGRAAEAARIALDLAGREREEGQLAAALETLSEAARLLPSQADVAAALRKLEADFAEYRRRSGLLERIEMANRLLAENRADAAVADLEEMLLSNPDNLEVQAGLAVAYRQCGRHVEAADASLRLARVYADRGALPAAMRQLEGILEYLPQHVPALEELVALSQRVNRARCLEYLMRLAAAHAGSGGWGFAEETYRRALAEQPENPVAWRGLAEALAGQGRPADAARVHLEAARQCELRLNSEEALRHCREALGLVPELSEAEERLIVLSAQLGRADEAEAHLLRAVALRQKRGECDRAITLLEEYLADHAEVLPLRTRLLELYREAGRTDHLVEQYLALARLYQQRVDRESAERQYEAVLSLEPAHVEAHTALAEACLSRGRWDEAARHLSAVADRLRADGVVGRALEFYRRALECLPDDLSLREAIAACFIDEGSPAKAVNEYILVGDVHFRNQAYAEALVAYGRAVELEPENLRTLGKLVSVHEAMGDPPKAAEGLFEMADLYARRSLTWKAREAAARALRLAPEESVLRRFLERSSLSGDLASALSSAREMLEFFPRPFQARAREILEEMQPEHRAVAEKQRLQPTTGFSYDAWQPFGGLVPAAGAPSPSVHGGTAPAAETSRGERPRPPRTPNPQEALSEALKLFSRRRYSRALSKLQEVAGMPRQKLSQNDLADLCSAMGQCLVELGYPKDAIEPFQSGLALAGIDAEREKSLQYGLARAFEECGQRAKAMELYKAIYLKDASYRDVKIRLLWSRKK